MAEIKQELTFDASTAISELDRLTNSLQGARAALNNFGRAVANFTRNSGGAVATMTNLATASNRLQTSLAGGIIPAGATSNLRQSTGLVDQFGRALSSTSTTAAAVAPAAKAAGAGLTTVGNRAARARPQVQALTIGFGTLGRILLTRLALSAFSGFIQGLRTSAQSAIEFQLQISEIQSITDNAFSSFDRAAESVRGVSDAFNQPLGEVGEGLYQVISNQIQGASAQIQVLESASNLAKVGVADLSSTVGLLTGTINAFQLDANNANQISAVFFETVRLGRTRISELGNSFGSVSTLAAEAGLSFEELAAAFATVTITGVDTAKAATQLRGILNAFLKPTTELARVLADAGFASGELALETLGLGGALALLENATGGSASELAKLIPRVRGLTGALVLARNGGEDLIKTTEEIQAASQDLLREKLDIRLETNAEQILSDLNRIKNALTVDVGQALLDLTKSFLNATGGADTLVPVIKTLTPLVLGIGVAALTAAVGLGLFTLAAKTASAANVALGVTSKFALRGLLRLGLSNSIIRTLFAFASSAVPIAIGFAIGAAIGKGLNDALVASAKKAAKEAGDAIREGIVTGERGEQLRQFEEDSRARIKAIKEVVVEEQKALAASKRLQVERTNTFLDANQTILNDSISIFNAILDANKELIRDLENEQKNADKSLEKSLDRQATLRDTIEDRAFKNSLGFLSDRQKLFKLEEQGARLAAQANRELAAATTEQQAAAALTKLDRAEGFLGEAEALARSSGEVSLQNRLFRTRQSISRDSLRSEQRFAQTQEEISRQAAATLAVEETRVKNLGRVVKSARDAVAAFKSAKTEEEKLVALEKAREAIGAITPELALGPSQRLDFDKLVSFDQFISNLSKNIGDTGVDITIDPVVELDRLSQEFFVETRQAVLAGIKSAEEAAAAAGFDLTVKLNVDESGIAQLQSTINQLLQAGQSEVGGIEGDLTLVRDSTRRFAEGQAALQEAAIEARNGASALINILGDAAILDTEKLTVFESQLGAVKLQAVAIAENLGNLTPGETLDRLNALRTTFDQLEDKAGFFDKAETTILRTEIDALINKLLEANESSFSTLITASQQASQNIQTVPESLQQGDQIMDSIVRKSAQAANNLLIANSQGTQAVGGTTGSATGKFFTRFLQGGGFSPRGTDTIPAMLSPGEFVVNARSSRRFFSQLQAINAGVKPVFRQDGGSVTNVGDVNVTVGAGRDSASTGRQIARSIRRELRRGTSSL